jgi:hypothetical protein
MKCPSSVMRVRLSMEKHARRENRHEISKKKDQRQEKSVAEKV